MLKRSYFCTLNMLTHTCTQMSTQHSDDMKVMWLLGPNRPFMLVWCRAEFGLSIAALWCVELYKVAVTEEKGLASPHFTIFPAVLLSISCKSIKNKSWNSNVNAEDKDATSKDAIRRSHTTDKGRDSSCSFSYSKPPKAQTNTLLSKV